MKNRIKTIIKIYLVICFIALVLPQNNRLDWWNIIAQAINLFLKFAEWINP